MLNIKTVFVTILLPFISLNVLAIEPKTITKNHGLSHLNDKPSDKISLVVKRDGKDITLDVTLRAKLGNTDLASSSKVAEKLGGKLETIDKNVAAKNDIEGGVVVKELGNGIIGKSRIEKGFVITHVNDKAVKNVEEFYEALKKATGNTIKLSGIYPGYFGNYAFMLNLNE